MSSRLTVFSSLPEPALPVRRERRDEAALVERLGRGDTEALPELWEVWNRPLFAYALRALGNVEDAEEVLQDALVRFWEKAPGYDAAQAQPFTWAMMIVRGLVFDRLRARRRRPVLVAELADPLVPAPDTMLPGQRADLETALATLTPDERQTLDLAVFHPATHEDIAARLAQPLGTIKSRLRRALDKLRAALTTDAVP